MFFLKKKNKVLETQIVFYKIPLPSCYPLRIIVVDFFKGLF